MKGRAEHRDSTASPGEGIYFWEHGYRRAAEFAEWKKNRGEIDEPMVLGAYIHLGRCFDLTDTWATSKLPDYFEMLRDSLEASAEALPENRAAGKNDFDLVLRDLDCAVLNLAMRMLTEEAAGDEAEYYQTVRGVFVEGDPVYQNARIHAKTHVQIAVRDPTCILGSSDRLAAILQSRYRHGTPSRRKAARAGLGTLQAMSAEERAQLLKRAGILDAQGHLAERYRPPDVAVQSQQSQGKDAAQ